MNPSPAGNPAFIIRSFGDDREQPVRFYLYEDVLDELVFACRCAADDEICAAVLTGGFGAEDSRGFIEITGFANLKTLAEPSELYRAMREGCDVYITGQPTAPIVGMFVGQKGGHARFDAEVARVHTSLFNVPFQPIVACDANDNTLSVSTRVERWRFANVAFRGVGVSESKVAETVDPSASGGYEFADEPRVERPDR